MTAIVQYFLQIQVIHGKWRKGTGDTAQALSTNYNYTTHFGRAENFSSFFRLFLILWMINGLFLNHTCRSNAGLLPTTSVEI